MAVVAAWQEGETRNLRSMAQYLHFAAGGNKNQPMSGFLGSILRRGVNQRAWGNGNRHIKKAARDYPEGQ